MTAPSESLRLLFVKHAQGWPRSCGHDIRGYHMLRTLRELGHVVGLATVDPPSREALNGLKLDYIGSLQPSGGDEPGRELRGPQRRFASYWGADPRSLQALTRVVDEFQPSAVIGLGLDILPYLACVENAERIWYAGDEWVRHHLSQMDWFRPSTWQELKHAAIRGLYERTFAGAVDRAWVVTPQERSAMRWFGGMRCVDVLPNGVDHVRYAPMAEPWIPQSAVFWGRLDFGPNVDALRWFCADIWPRVRLRVPTATFHVMGFSPGPDIVALNAIPGITVASDVDDLRPEIAKRSVVVLPFESGGGIKNKFLEAAAMGKAIVCTRRACEGLQGQPPATLASGPEEWVSALVELWEDEARCRALGAGAREWVLREHSWQATAHQAVAHLRSNQPLRRSRRRSERVPQIEKTIADASAPTR